MLSAERAMRFADADRREPAHVTAPVFESIFRKRIQIHVARNSLLRGGIFTPARMNALVTFSHFFPGQPARSARLPPSLTFPRLGRPARGYARRFGKTFTL